LLSQLEPPFSRIIGLVVFDRGGRKIVDELIEVLSRLPLGLKVSDVGINRRLNVVVLRAL
jgi:hypothetical protein